MAVKLGPGGYIKLIDVVIRKDGAIVEQYDVDLGEPMSVADYYKLSKEERDALHERHRVSTSGDSTHGT